MCACILIHLYASCASVPWEELEVWVGVILVIENAERSVVCRTAPHSRPASPPAAPATSTPLRNTVSWHCERTLSNFYDFYETVYDFFMKDTHFSEEVRKPVLWRISVTQWKPWCNLDHHCDILDTLNSTIYVKIISGFRALLSLFSFYQYGWNEGCLSLDFFFFSLNILLLGSC